MKWIPLFVVLAFLAGCSRAVVVNLGEHMPAPAFIQEQDSAYREAWQWIERGDPDKAIKVFQTSGAPLEIKHIGFAYAFLAKNRIGLAREQFEKSLALAPDNIVAELGLASTYELAGERENAFAAYARLLAKYPDEPLVKSKYLEIKSAAAGEYLALAEKERADGREDKYIAALEQAAHYSPDVIPIQRQIAEFYFARKKWDKALAHFQELRSKEPENIEVLQRLVDIYETTDKLDRAILTIDELLALQPGNEAWATRKKTIRERFQLLNLPPKFKDIFFKKEVTREDLAALIGFYFQDYLKMGESPVILTDIDTSFARDEIIKIASTGIIRERPNHTFDRSSLPDRAALAEILNTLITYLSGRGYTLTFPPRETSETPADISPEHRNYRIITFLIQAQLIALDNQKNFNPTAAISPVEVVAALQKIMNAIRR